MDVANPSSARLNTCRMFVKSPLTPLYSTPKRRIKTERAIKETTRLQNSPTIPNIVFFIDFSTRDCINEIVYVLN